MKAIIMIPTYNEKENIASLIESLFSIPLRSQDSLEIVVVDDASPDGTGIVVRELQSRYSHQLFLVERKHERGRGTAGIAGFRFCLDRDVDCILEMDADFSHDPKYLPAFLALSEHYDVVIGSRLVEGGSDASRKISRVFVSLVANFIYRLLLGMRLRDISGGYKCYRKATMARLSFDHFFSTGYPIGMETLFRCHQNGATFLEVPIHFQDRKRGQSKFVLKEALNAFWIAFKLCLHFRWMA